MRSQVIQNLSHPIIIDGIGAITVQVSIHGRNLIELSGKVVGIKHTGHVGKAMLEEIRRCLSFLRRTAQRAQ